ncbi:MAG: oxidoreductase [Solirubrobacterales bacterium]|nr:oxidoreductase [Solirubrobacterales bacterium]
MTFAPAERPPARPRWAPSPQRAIAIAYVTAIFMTGIDMQIVNVALPTLSEAFGVPLTDVQWTVIAYLLTLAIVIPASGWIGDRIGTKRTFVFALALFTLASALCGLAQSLPELIAARALQGVGGGLLTPTGTSMLYRAYAPEQRARVARTLIMPILIGPGSAPILGGVLTQTLSWRWVFLINVPFGIVMCAFTYFFVAEHRPSPAGRLDVLGLVLSGLGLSALLYAISEGSVLGWGSPVIIGAGLGGVLLLWLFAREALRRPDPILQLRLLREPLLRSTNIVFALTTSVFLASLYLTPIFLQQVMGQTPIKSGTTTFVEVIGVAVGSQTLGRLYPRIGPRIMCTIGGFGLTLYLLAFLLVDDSTSLWVVRGLMFFGGFGNSGAFLAIQTSMFGNISSADTGHASAIYNTQRQSSIAINTAIVTTIVAGAGGTALEAFHAAYLGAAIMAALGTVLAWTLIDNRLAGSTMVRSAPRGAADVGDT